MQGLLYKDFLTIKGKIYMWSLIAIAGVVLVYRMLVEDQENDMTGSKSMKLGIDLRNKKWISISKTRRTIWNN